MRSPRSIAWRLVVLAPALWSCSLSDSIDLDGGRDARREPDAEPADGGDARVEGGVGDAGGRFLLGPGPMTFVAAEIEALQDRLCDLDGDGALDNSIDDLGEPGSGLFATVLSQALAGVVEERETRIVVHFPWVEDRGVPATLASGLVAFEGLDVDRPPDPSDDLGGEGSFFASFSSLDDCGGPRFIFAEAQLAAGMLSARGGTIPIPSIVTGRGASATGRVLPGGVGAEVDLCAYLTVSELGEGPGFYQSGELSTLEVLLAGGGAFGISAMAGLDPDVDLDGDGLERIVLDADLRVERCIDGDLTEIAGTDCWRDDRMADAFSMNLRLSLVPVRFAGPWPAWRWETPGDCPEPGGRPSAWGPCAASSGVCSERWQERSCSAECGSGTSACDFDCWSWGACVPDASREISFDGCADVQLHEGATCDETSGTVQLVSGFREARGAELIPGVEVGRGPVVIDAVVRASRGSTERPADGWAIVALTKEEEPFVGALGGNLAINFTQGGYALEWRFLNRVGAPGDQERDLIRLVELDGAGGHEEACVGRCLFDPEPRLDSSTEGAVEQRLRLVLHPDLPETDANEHFVTGRMITAEGSRWADVACHDYTCLTRVSTGDRLRVGVTGASGDLDSSITLVELTAISLGACAGP